MSTAAKPIVILAIFLNRKDFVAVIVSEAANSRNANAVFGAIGMYPARIPFNVEEPVNQPISAVRLINITASPHACDMRGYFANKTVFNSIGLYIVRKSQEVRERQRQG